MPQVVQLKNIEAFRQALADYSVSDSAKAVLDQAKLVVLSGLAGGGRNTVINELVKNYGYFFLVSDTTRPPKLRNGAMEQDGVHYYFRNEEDMLREIENGEFIEAELIHNQQVSGTSIRELQRANETSKIAIHDFEFGGANNVAAAAPKATIIGLLPPSYDEWIQRFTAREEISKQEFRNRLETAEKVLANMLEKPYFKLVVNDTIEHCAEKIHAIVTAQHEDPAYQQQCRSIAENILDNVREYLASN